MPLVLLLAALLTLASPAHAQSLSARRLPHETAAQAEQRARRELRRPASRSRREDPSAADARRPWSELDFSRLPDYGTTGELLALFRSIRDRQTLEDGFHEDFLRRPSWLFPDDGCFARAGVVSAWLEEMGKDRPLKAFIFGNLRVQTANHPKGEVRWWYHVVPIVLADRAPYVLDPAIDPARPMKLRDWALRQADELGSVQLSICHARAHEPDDSCANGRPSADQDALDEQSQTYLFREWERMLELGRDPYSELNGSPPWL